MAHEHVFERDAYVFEVHVAVVDGAEAAVCLWANVADCDACERLVGCQGADGDDE
jgi:hypothetical protein